MTITAYNMPFTFDTIDLAEGGRTFWKQLLPLGGKIDYNGQKLEFTRDMLEQIAKSYSDKAYDQVAFQLADDRNGHPSEEEEDSGNMDPKRFHGEVSRLKLDKRGLFGQFNLTEEGAKLVGTNPKLGVSVRLKDYDRADGKRFPFALRHVLGTLDPKVAGMAPWSTVELSNTEENEEVADLTAAGINTDTNKSEDTKTETTETISVPKDEWESLKSYVNEMREADKDLEDMLKEDDKETVDASNQLPTEVINLSNEVASERFARYADGLVRQGVPPVMIDEARKVLGKSDLVDLSNDGSENDPKVVIKKILEEAKGTVDLSESSITFVPNDEANKLEEEYKAAEAFLLNN